MSQENIQVEEHGAHIGAVHTGHPTPATYFKVAMILSALTAIEVAIFYITPLSYGIIPILAVLSIGKFVLVILYYMHLKFDSKVFSGMFFFGLFVATGVIFSLMALFGWFLL